MKTFETLKAEWLENPEVRAAYATCHRLYGSGSFPVAGPETRCVFAAIKKVSCGEFNDDHDL
jgi:hypothetical protein